LKQPQLILCALVLTAMSACAASAQPGGPPEYRADFEAEFMPEAGFARASLTISQSDGEMELLDFSAPADRFSDFSGDGEIARSGKRLVWKVPRKGGRLDYRVRIDHQRNGVYDARMTSDWAIARLGDLFPAARSSTVDDALSRSSLLLSGPAGWRFETRYGSAGKRVRVREKDRRFDRPTGWMAAGKLGVRREKINGRQVTVAAPRGIGVKRLEVLAFLRWNLPALVEVFPHFPESVLIVGAPSEMWRGGLSGPGSLYLHADRPMISENATSPLLHELVHVATAFPPADGDDWIVEGLAEYYGLEILRRTGTISGQRFEDALSWLADWSDRNEGHLADPSTGANTAEAVCLFHALNQELKAAGASLDQVVIELFAEPDPNRHRLRGSLRKRLGHPSPILDSALADAPPGEAPQ